MQLMKIQHVFHIYSQRILHCFSLSAYVSMYPSTATLVNEYTPECTYTQLPPSHTNKHPVARFLVADATLVRISQAVRFNLTRSTLIIQ